jgi:XTP/dITP diphosphohydrolase
MMQTLIFATNNNHKLREVSPLLQNVFDIKGLDAVGCTDDIPETADTLEGNALQKARYVAQKYGVNCFADDTGLEVEALDNRPGVYSARYAGPQRDANDNMELLLSELEGQSNRRARFRTVIALIIDGNEHLFEGVVEGEIMHTKTGKGGFGYDPIFKAQGFDVSFAEMTLEQKNKVSHRARATRKLIEFLTHL